MTGSHFEAKEAAVIVSDGEFEVLAFCYPCDYSEGEILEEPLTVFESENVKLFLEAHKYSISQIGYESSIVAKIENRLGDC